MFICLCTRCAKQRSHPEAQCILDENRRDNACRSARHGGSPGAVCMSGVSNGAASYTTCVPTAPVRAHYPTTASTALARAVDVPLFITTPDGCSLALDDCPNINPISAAGTTTYTTPPGHQSTHQRSTRRGRRTATRTL